MEFRAADACPPAFQTFLSGCYLQSIRMVLFPESIRLEADHLTFEGKTEDIWLAKGLGNAEIRIEKYCIYMDQDTVDCTASGRLVKPGEVPVLIQLISNHDKAFAWKIIRTAVSDASFYDIMRLTGEMSFVNHSALQFLDHKFRIDRENYAILFNAVNSTAMQKFSLSNKDAEWVAVPGVISLLGITLNGMVSSNTFLLSIIGHMEMGGRKVDLTVNVTNSCNWKFMISSGEFPSLTGILQWAFESVGAESVTKPFGSMSFNLKVFDASIYSIIVEADVYGGSLNYVLVSGCLSVFGIDFDVSVSLPRLTVLGKLSRQIQFLELVKSFGIPAEYIPQNIAMTTITQADFNADLKKESFAVGISVNMDWKIGPVTLCDVFFSVYFMKKATGSFRCSLLFCDDIYLKLMARALEDRWEFEGSLGSYEIVDMKDMLCFLERNFGISEVPEAIKTLELYSISLTCDTKCNFCFTCNTGFQADGRKCLLELSVIIAQDGGNTSVDFNGKLDLGGIILDVIFTKPGEQEAGVYWIYADYHQDETTTVSLMKLLSSVLDSAESEIPGELELNLKQISLLFYHEKAIRKFALSVLLGMHFELYSLPLIGEHIPENIAFSLDDVRAGYNSQAFTDTQIIKINDSLQENANIYPQDGLPQGFFVYSKISLNGKEQTLLAGGGETSSGLSKAAKSKGKTAGGSSKAAEGGKAAPVKWVELQKQLGPVYLSRIGMSMSGGVLAFLLDCGLTINPLTFTVMGLKLESPLDRFEPKASLQGVGVSCSSPEFSIGGSFHFVPPQSEDVTAQYEGSLMVQAGKWSLAAIGSYTQTKCGAPVFFLFLDANMMLGGPPAFTITGLLGGLGINQRIRYPDFNEVADFPLLALDRPGHTKEQMLDLLKGRTAMPGKAKKEWLSDSPGTYWIAAGLKFSSFEMIKGKLMLSARFGASDLEIALVGIADMALPKGSKPESSFVYVQLQMAVRFAVREGCFQIGAALTPASFLLHKDCHLTGGFALCFWFGEHQNAGQFVLSIGGYHPAFQKPEYYPAVDRIGIHWKVSSEVEIKGEAYLAVTPSCAMAGGRLEIHYQLGSLRAWFIAYANFLVTWNPFSFLAEIGVEIGVEYTFTILGCSRSIGIKLGATLTMWGPPVGGIVHIHILFLSFSVSFGSRDALTANSIPLTWTEFAKNLPEREEVCSVQISRGLSQKKTETSKNKNRFIVSGSEVAFFTSSAIPFAAEGGISIRPMNLEDVVSSHKVVIEKDGKIQKLQKPEGWSIRPIPQKVPESMWGKPNTVNGKFTHNPNRPSAALVEGFYTGMTIIAPQVSRNGKLVIKNYQHALRHFVKGSLPWKSDGPFAGEDGSLREYMAIENESVQEAIKAMEEEKNKLKRKQVREMLSQYFTLDAGEFPMLSSQSGQLFKDLPLEAYHGG